MPSPLAEHHVQTRARRPRTRDRAHDGSARRRRDPTLQHPNCVYQIMRRHYARYTPEMVERVDRLSRETSSCKIVRRADAAIPAASAPARSATRWAGRITRTGVQIIRAAAIIQGLLGNIGRPGGGMLALRGHCSIQGSTDIPTLYNMLPTYLPQPNALQAAQDLRGVPGGRDGADRLVAQLPEIHGQPAEGLVRRRGAAGE